MITGTKIITIGTRPAEMVPFDPSDGTWLWATAAPYSADPTGVADAKAAISSCMADAAVQGKGVYIPAGTYKLLTGLVAPPGANQRIRGAGRSQTTLSMPAPAAITYMLTAQGLTGLSLSDLTFYTPNPCPNRVRAFYGEGLQAPTLARLGVNTCDYGFKFGSGLSTSGLRMEDIVTNNIGLLSLFIANVSQSSFQALALQNRNDTGGDMCIYVERDNHYLTFQNIDLTGGSRNCIQFYSESPTVSDHVTMDTVRLDHSAGPKYPISFDDDWSDITITNLIALGRATSPTEAVFIFYGGKRIVIDGFTATGGTKLVSGDYVAAAQCEVKNGTYPGLLGGYTGVAITNVSAA